MVDNETAPAPGDPTRKIQPVLDVLTDRFLMCYNPGQELSVDEEMIKYKGRAKVKVHMPKKPVIRYGAALVHVMVICVIFKGRR